MEDGFWQLPHDELSAVLRRNDLSWETARVFLALADLTRGHAKDADRVSLSQIATHAGMTSGHVSRALRQLRGMGLYGDARSEDGKHVLSRRVVWPAPGTAKAGTTEGGTTGGGTAGIDTAKGTTGAGRYQYTNTKTPAPLSSGTPKAPRARGSKRAPSGTPKANAWAWWIDANRKAGRTDPAGIGPDLRAGKELGKLVTAGNVTEDELRDCMRLFLADTDPFLAKQGHALRLLSARINSYRNSIAENEPPPMDPAEVDRIEAAAAEHEKGTA